MRRSSSFIFLGVVALLAVVAVWHFTTSQSNNPFSMASIGETVGQPALGTGPTATSSDQDAAPAPTSSVVVPTTTAMELSDPSQDKLPGTLIVDDSSTAASADGMWSASMQMIKEYPITYSFNDGNGPDLIVDDAYLLVTNLKTGAKKQVAVLDLAPDAMIANAKNAVATAQYEYVTYDLTWMAGTGGSSDQITGKAELYDVTKGTNSAKLIQSAKFTVNPATWTVSKK